MLDQLLSLGEGLATDVVVGEAQNLMRGAVQAFLGAIGFGVLIGPECQEESFSANFAEHSLIEGKPRLQWVGDNLNEVTWNLMFHAGFCDPAFQLLLLRKAVAAHVPLPLVLYNGAHNGWFVPVSVDVTTRMTRADGSLLWIEARLALREAPPPALLDALASQDPVAVSQNNPGGAISMPSGTVYKVPDARPIGAVPLRGAP